MDFSVIVRLIDRISAPVRNISNQFDHLNQKIDTSRQRVGVLESIGTKLARLGSIASKVGAVSGISAAGIGASATNVSAKYEDLGAVFETLEGSSEKAQSSLAWVKKFAKDTPYELSSTAEAFSRLRAYGIDPTDGTLMTLGDTAAAMGKDVMSAVEMMADAVVGENERLKEFGIRGSAIKGTNLIEYTYKNKLGEQLTRTVNKNDQNEIRRILNEIFSEKYSGAMEKRSKTFNGILSKMKDTLAELQDKFMSQGLFTAIKASLESRLAMLDKLSASGAIERWGQAAADVYNAVGAGLDKIIGRISDANKKMSEFVGGWGNLGRALGLIKDKIPSGHNIRTQVLPQWLKPNKGSAAGETMMSPLLDQLRIIEKGDTLWKIAKQTSGMGTKYTEIAELNRHIIKDADKILPGQQIRIPKRSALPEWVKQRTAIPAGEMSPVPMPAGNAVPMAQNLRAIAELAKENKVIAFAVLLRKTWDSIFGVLKSGASRLKAELSSRFDHIADYVIANSEKIATIGRIIALGIKTQFNLASQVAETAMLNIRNWMKQHGQAIESTLSLLGRAAVATITRWPTIAGNTLQFLSGVWQSALGKMTTSLPKLLTSASSVLGVVGQWFDDNAQKIKNTLGAVAAKVIDKFAVKLDLLNAQANDGTLSKWLDELYAKIEPGTNNLLSFASGIWIVIKGISAFIVKTSDAVGGWENFGKLVAGIAVVTLLGPVIGAFGSLLLLVHTTGAITSAVIGIFYRLSDALGINAAIATRVGQAFQWLRTTLSVGNITTALSNAWRWLGNSLSWVARTALPMVGRALMIVGRAALLNPIGLAITAIAGAAYLLYQNWDKFVNWWNSSTLKKQVMPVVTKALDYAQSKGEQLKSWWNNATLPEKIMGIATTPVQIAKTIAADFFNWWLTTELGQKALKIATDALDWARAKAEEFRKWWDSWSLASKATEISSRIRKIVGTEHVEDTFQASEFSADGERAMGGPVRAGGIYRVNELGPELLSMRGNTYLMADHDANVIPLRQMVNRSTERHHSERSASVMQALPELINNIIPLRQLTNRSTESHHSERSSTSVMQALPELINNIIPLRQLTNRSTESYHSERSLISRINERLFGQPQTPGRASAQTIPQIIDFQQRQRAQPQEVKTDGVLHIKIDSKEPVRVQRMQATGMQLNVHTGAIGGIS